MRFKLRLDLFWQFSVIIAYPLKQCAVIYQLALDPISIKITDSHDYDGEFSHADVLVTWVQVSGSAAEKCRWELNVDSEEAEDFDEPICD